jgi:hypothetical protein
MSSGRDTGPQRVTPLVGRYFCGFLTPAGSCSSFDSGSKLFKPGHIFSGTLAAVVSSSTLWPRSGKVSGAKLPDTCQDLSDQFQRRRFP